MFPSEVFVKLVAYADESHSGKDDSEVLIVAGWIALRDEWSEFCDQWRKVLKKYDAPYFHFREWSDASSVARGKRPASSEFRKKNPYKHLDQIKLDAFLIELAKIAAFGNKLTIGGYVPQNQLIKDKNAGLVAIDKNADELCIKHFFDSVVSTISRERSPLKRQPIAFFFDQSNDAKWKRIVMDGYNSSQSKNRNFKEIFFADKKEHFPLQAADMVAYRLRQKMEDLVTFDISKSWSKFDNIIFKKINDWSAKLNPAETDAMLRRVFDVPKDATYDEAMNSIVLRQNENRTKK